MKQHKIGWLNTPGHIPETWNPIIGCSKVSPGCENCYAEKMATRLSVILGKKGEEPSYAWIGYSDVITNGKWNGQSALIKSAIIKPDNWKKPRAVFVCSMGDLFHESVPFEWIDAVFSVMSDNDQHTYIILTKRPEQAHKFFLWKSLQHNTPWVPKNNIWFGVTAENQEQANKRIPDLLRLPASIRFVSIEPMLGAIDLNKIPAKYWGSEYNTAAYNGINLSALYGGQSTCTPWHLDWVIVGGETGNRARPMHPDWVRSIRKHCKEAEVPFFFKQWGEWSTEYPQNRSLANMDQTYQEKTSFYKVGKKTAGNLLDNEQHHNWPNLDS